MTRLDNRLTSYVISSNLEVELQNSYQVRTRSILPVFILGLVVYLLVGVSSVLAQSVSSSSYDWSTTLEVPQSQVLGVTYPHESTQSAKTTKDFSQYNGYLFGGNLTPANPFYFIKPLQENIRLTFTFDQKAKDQIKVGIAGERLDELQQLANSKNSSALASAATAYQQMMGSVSDDLTALKKTNTNVDDLVKKVEEETAKHNVVLEEVKIQVPDSAGASLDKALQASWRGTDTVADLKGRPAVPEDVVSRLQSLKSQGLLTQEEVSKLISVKTRVEARSEIEKYVNQGIVSPSDFLRLDETAKSFYPDEFYQVHEVMRFEELQKLESEKPDNATLTKIQTFAKSYQPGDPVPSELRKYWVPVVRLEEIQNTLRPDLIDANLFKQDNQETKKFNEVVERFKPRPEDIASLNSFIKKNNSDVNNLPPEYQRMYNLSQRYGAQCGAGYNWVPETQNPSGGYCAPQGSNNSNMPKYDDFTKGKTCSGAIVSAKATSGACSAYPVDCLPPGWGKVDSCVSTPTGSGGPTNTAGNRPVISCPTNAHFVSVSYDPNGGYCIPNYTVSTTGITGTNGSGQQYEAACSNGYHRSYQNGPCVLDYNTGLNGGSYNYNNYLPQLTTTPGGAYYPNNGSRCGGGSHWVPEPVNPSGGYCAQDSYQGGVNSDGNSASPNRESQEATCRAGGGVCVSWVNGACGCVRGGSSTNTGGTGTGIGSNSPSGCSMPPSGCPGGYYDFGACTCRINGSTGSNSSSNGTSPSRESQEAACWAGGGTCQGWYNGACSCIHNNSGSTGGSTPPSGYGGCGSGMKWNGSYCVNENSPTNYVEDPATACRRGGACTWNGSSCQCGTSPSGGGSSATPAPASTTAPAATQTPTQSTPAPASTSAPADTSAPASTTPP